MSRLSHPLAMPAPLARSVAIAALLGATMLASPMTAARADTASTAPSQATQGAAPQTKAAAGAMATKAETVEQRITSLHTALKITPPEEADWTNVAQAMRENAAAMQKLVADDTVKAPQSMTAVDDLKTYQKFAQAHVDGSEEPDVVVRDALQFNARCAEEGCRSGVPELSPPGRRIAQLTASTIAARRA